MSLASLRVEARSIFGRDAEQYAAGRPDYPADVYRILRTRCGLRPGTLVLEIGPGTGLVTRHLLDTATRVIAVEPDLSMIGYLETAVPTAEVVAGTFEEAELGSSRFDLAVSAAAFHWVAQDVGIPKLARVLRPRGWTAVWWTIFDDPDSADPFRDELEQRFGQADPGAQRNVQFQMDLDGRCSDLVRLGGFVEVAAEVVHWTVDMNSVQLQALYGSMMAVRRRSDEERRQLIGAVRDLAENEFGGIVARPFVTVLYTARQPDGG